MINNNNKFKKTKIGVFSSSSCLSAFFNKRINKAKQIFLQQGYEVNLGDLIFQKIGNYTTGTIKQRANEFNTLLLNNDVLISSIGGFNCSSILPYINYDLIKQNKTRIVGLSDTTAILLAIYAKTNVPVYYGQSFLKSYDENEFIQQINLNSFKAVVIEQKYPICLSEPKFYNDDFVDWNNKNYLNLRKMKNNGWSWINPNKVTGRLIGGNLTTLIPIYNTQYMPQVKEGDIMFIEDSEKNIAQCERNFAFLKNSGILDKVSGVIIGKAELIDSLNSDWTYEKLFLEFLDRKIPVLMHFDCGHTLPSYLLKIGGIVTLDPQNNQVIIEK